MQVDPARLERFLTILDDIAEIGVVLTGRLRDHPPAPKQDVARDFDIITRSIRRTILLSMTITSGKFVPSLPTAAPETPDKAPDKASDPAADDRGASPSDTRLRDRLDRLDRLDDISGPFEHTVASIIRDIRTVVDGLAPSPNPTRPERPRPHRPEADLADLE